MTHMVNPKKKMIKDQNCKETSHSQCAVHAKWHCCTATAEFQIFVVFNAPLFSGSTRAFFHVFGVPASAFYWVILYVAPLLKTADWSYPGSSQVVRLGKGLCFLCKSFHMLTTAAGSLLWSRSIPALNPACSSWGNWGDLVWRRED